VPAYKEEVSVVRKTLIAAALQAYPERRIVLLVDDPPEPANSHDRAGLSAMRRLPQEIGELLREPRLRSQAAFAAFHHRLAGAAADLGQERRRLARLHRDIGAWFDHQAATHPMTDHVDQHFVELAYREQASWCFMRSLELSRPGSTDSDVERLDADYRRLVGLFDAQVTSFERKRYENLSHASNKAMNLNSYLGLMGRAFREVATPRGTWRLEETTPARADLAVADSEYVLMVDADSVLHPDYTARLVHFMEQPGHETIAVVQTPYNAFPNAAGALERVAGA